MFRAFLATLIALLILLVLIVQAAKAIWPAPTPLLIEASAYTAQFRPKAKRIIIRPAPKPPAQPKHHRLKGSMEPFNRFEFDQRSIV